MLIHVFLTNRHRTHWEEKNLAPNEGGGDSLFERNGERGKKRRKRDNSQSGHSLVKEIADWRIFQEAENRTTISIQRPLECVLLRQNWP